MGGELAHVALAFQGAPAGSPQALALAVAAKGTTTNLNTNTNLNSHLYFTTLLKIPLNYCICNRNPKRTNNPK